MPAQPALDGAHRRAGRRAGRVGRVALARPASPASPPGLGLAALLSHFGLSEGFGSMLLIAARGGRRLVARPRAHGAPRAPAAAPMRYAAAAAPPRRAARSRPTRAVRARMGGGTSPRPPAPRRYPPGFEPAPFVEQAKRQFRKLQPAYDSGDRKALAEVMTPDMHAEIADELAQRGHAGAHRGRHARRRGPRGRPPKAASTG